MTSKLGTALYDWTPAAVVFDCDGLLMDTEPCWTVAETALFQRRGLPFGPEQKALVIGKSMAGLEPVLEAAFGEPGTGPELVAELLELVFEQVSGTAAAMPGAHALVEAAGRAVPVAVASNSPRALLDIALGRGGFVGTFAVTLAADEVANPKPAPDMYRISCDRLGVATADALAFEDSMTGLRSAKAAGLRLVGVPTLEHADFPADHVVTSLLDADLVAWVDGWAQQA